MTSTLNSPKKRALQAFANVYKMWEKREKWWKKAENKKPEVEPQKSFGGTESEQMFEQKINAPRAGKLLQAKLPFPLHFCILRIRPRPQLASPPPESSRFFCNANVIKWRLSGIA